MRKHDLPLFSPNNSGKAGGASVRLGFLFQIVVALLVMLFNAQAQPVVSNVRAGQEPGTGLVDIYYDLADATSSALTVSVEVSTNGGASYTLPAKNFTGDVGSGVTPGANKKIIWNAGADWPGQYSTKVRFRVIADDSTTPAGMVLIPAGSYQMGDALDGESDALPVHTVYVSAFYMDKFDVTEALWAQVYNWATNHGYSFDDPGSVYDGRGYSKGPNYPVVDVDWYDVVKWCNARSEMEGRTPAYYTTSSQTVVYRTGDLDISNACVNWNGGGYRLPTEAEWEKAARGGLSGQRFPWGNTINESQANYYADPLALDPYGYAYAYDVNSYIGFNTNFDTGNFPYTSPVNYFAPNGYGLYDMAGNVWQWCWDCWDGSYYSSSPSSDPRGPATNSGARVLRGGDWSLDASYARCAVRYYDGSPGDHYDGYGFRCVRGL